MNQVLIFNKPFNVLSQFSDENNANSKQVKRDTLANYIDQPGFYAAGRLDRDSEGLLILTNDGKLQNKITSPKFKQTKIYLAQVEGELDKKALKVLQQGVMLKDGLTLPAKAKTVQEPCWLWDRIPPIRERKNIPTSWLELSITEGKIAKLEE